MVDAGLDSPLLQPVKAARAALADAEDEATVAAAANTGLNTRIADTRDACQSAAVKVDAAARAVLWESPAVRSMAAEVNRLQTEYIAKGRALCWLVGAKIIPTTPLSIVQPGAEHYEISRLCMFINQLPVWQAPGINPRDYPYDSPPVSAAPWIAALAALQADANAPLPSDA